MNQLLTKYYLQLSLGLAFSAAALWTLVVLFGFTSLEASGADATAAALGLVVCFLVVFLAAVLVSGFYDVWRGTRAEEALETALWAAPVQRERLGFVLLAGSLLLLVSGATGTLTQPAWLAISSVLLFGGGLMLVGSALRDEVGPARPFHRHLKRKEAQRKEAERQAAQRQMEEKQEEAGTEAEAPEEEASGDPEEKEDDTFQREDDPPAARANEAS